MKKFKTNDMSNPNEKQTNLTDKAFMHSIAVSVLSIVMCLVFLCAATWAWFSSDITSQTNTIQTQSYQLSIAVASNNNQIALEEDPTGHYTATLAPNTAYTVTLTASGTGKNGYCKLLVNGESYFTDLVTIKNSNESTVSTFTFKLTATEETTAIPVSFDLRWGTYSGTAHIIADGKGVYTIDIINHTITNPEKTATEDTADQNDAQA